MKDFPPKIETQGLGTLDPGMQRMDHSQFIFLTDYLAKKYGLKITADKKTLLESRLQSRIMKLGLQNVEQYIQYVFNNPEGKEEYQFFIENITTHKTFFFRERHQFDFMADQVKNEVGTGKSKMYRIWSAGCSTGEEVYTIAMVMAQLRKQFPQMDYKITGTDISVPSLKKAAIGEYSTMEMENVSEELKERYFFKRETSMDTLFRFSDPEIKSRINFGILNLNKSTYNLPFQYDFIFCRNVIIYFDNETKTEVMRRLITKLKPSGVLFLGHSESAIGANLPIVSIRPTIYERTNK